jgi:hypothetical protein
MNNIITNEKLKKYFSITGKAIEKVKIIAPESTPLKKIADDYFDMAKRYFDDAKHFEEKGEIVTAFAALNYAHGWLDAGARIGLFDVEHDSILFTVD